MARRWGLGLSAAAVALGLGHLTLGAIAFEPRTLDALWFQGSGVAIVLGGLLNLFAQLACYGKGGRALLGIANLAALGFFALALMVVPEPQVIFGTFLFAALLVIAVIQDRRGPGVPARPEQRAE